MQYKFLGEVIPRREYNQESNLCTKCRLDLALNVPAPSGPSSGVYILPKTSSGVYFLPKEELYLCMDLDKIKIKQTNTHYNWALAFKPVFS